MSGRQSLIICAVRGIRTCKSIRGRRLDYPELPNRGPTAGLTLRLIHEVDLRGKRKKRWIGQGKNSQIDSGRCPFRRVLFSPPATSAYYSPTLLADARCPCFVNISCLFRNHPTRLDATCCPASALLLSTSRNSTPPPLDAARGSRTSTPGVVATVQAR